MRSHYSYLKNSLKKLFYYFKKYCTLVLLWNRFSIFNLSILESIPNFLSYFRFVPLHSKVLNIEIMIVGVVGGIASTYSALFEITGPGTFVSPCYVNPSAAGGSSWSHWLPGTRVRPVYYQISIVTKFGHKGKLLAKNSILLLVVSLTQWVRT